MAKIVLQSNASGNGTLTISAPSTNTDFTLNIPAESGSLLTSTNLSEINVASNTLVVNTGNVAISGNTTVTGLLTTNILQVGTVNSQYSATISSSESGGTRAYIVNANNSTAGVFLESRNTSNVALSSATIRVANTGALEVFNGASGSENNTLTIAANGSATFLYSLTTPNTIYHNNANSSSPFLYVRGGGDGNTRILRVSAAETNENVISNLDADYGFTIAYRGDRTGVQNSLDIYPDGEDVGSQTEAWSMRQDGIIRMPKQPRFYAYGVSGGTFAHNSNWIFPTTRVNQGGHYSTSTGRFTAPVTGTYFFTWGNIAGNTNDVFRYYFRLNGTNVGDVHLRQDTNATGTEYATSASRNFMISLSAGDYVNIYYTSDSGAASYPGSNASDNDYLYFGGYLIG